MYPHQTYRSRQAIINFLIVSVWLCVKIRIRRLCIRADAWMATIKICSLYKTCFMELELTRACFSDGTNGEILYNGSHLVYTIELPWKDNHTGVSCIPEGKYALTKRHNEQFGWHFLVKDVPSRVGILIHPANHALLELRGCIAPVLNFTGLGKGTKSREALAILRALIYPVFERNEKVFLTIKILSA